MASFQSFTVVRKSGKGEWQVAVVNIVYICTRGRGEVEREEEIQINLIIEKKRNKKEKVSLLLLGHLYMTKT